MKVRIAIREQLAALVVFAVLIGLAIVSVPVWIFVNNFVVGVESNGLALTASLKAARISSEINLIQSSCQSIASRLLLQTDITNFYNQNWTNYPDPSSAWADASADLKSALNSAGFTALLQARLYSRNITGNKYGLLNVTSGSLPPEPIILPFALPDGTRAVLSDTEHGYPAELYPNITYIDQNRTNSIFKTEEVYAASPFPDISLTNATNGGGLMLGPLVINETFALMSITIPIKSNNYANFVMGYMTVVASAKAIIDVQMSQEGLGSTGTVLIVGSSNPWNKFNSSLAAANGTNSVDRSAFAAQTVRFILPPIPPEGQEDRHSDHNFRSSRFDKSFNVTDYPAAFDLFSKNNSAVNNASATLSTTNEQGLLVAVGAAKPATTLVTWAILVEQDDGEAFAPIKTLQNILLGCVFATAGLVLVLIVPCAHISVMPIRRLKTATENSIAPPGYEDEFDPAFDEENPSSGGTTSGRSEKGLFASIRRQIKRRRKARLRAQAIADASQRGFKIPARVESRKHFVTDELTELTDTFNAMTEELLKQYTSLDEKVSERTRELEISKKAAEAANESKTRFIANISHELKTPLNGIMGMCAVCMEEDDIVRIKQSLKTLYKSGDLLLHLLEDLLHFSKNQIGQQLSLEEREFRLGDIRSQMLSIFDKQVKENGTSFNVTFIGLELTEALPGLERTSLDTRLPALGPAGVGRLKDMCLWGDQHRILQVIINLVSNSLKFTPPGGKVDLRIRCLGEAEQTGDESRTSSLSKTGSNRAGRSRHRVGSSSTHSVSASSQATQLKTGTALSINPMDPKATPYVHVRERSPTPPPANAKTYLFEFEVEDTGPGIAEHMQEKIFEPFVQGDLGLSKKYGGTGLGLSICSQLATIMGGKISLKSTVGVGTTFIMQIPLKYVKDRASSTASSSLKSRPPSVSSADGENIRNSLKSGAAAEGKGQGAPAIDTKQPRLVGLSLPFFASNPNPPNSGEDQMAVIERVRANKSGQGKLRVLVADDNSTNIEVVSRLLKLEDIYDVTIAKDGQEAFDLVKANMENNQRFDVIFMDIQMPNLDGLQSTRLIRKMGYSAPIVALTAFSEESNVKECMESGMDEFLSKPIRRPALKQVLKKFATIPEEPETMSLTRRTTPEKTPVDAPGKQSGKPFPAAKSNGSPSAKGPVPAASGR